MIHLTDAEKKRVRKAKQLKFAKKLRREMTDAEKILWEALRNRKLNGYKFCRQVPIGAFVADFCCRSQRFIVEVDGGIHDQQQEYDEARTDVLRSYGYIVIRVRNDEVEHDLSNVLRKIAWAIRKYSVRLSSQ